MKKFYLLIFSVIAVAITVFFVAGCNSVNDSGEGADNTYTVNFYYEGEKVCTQYVEAYGCATKPEPADYGLPDGVFWYCDGSLYDFSQPVLGNLNLTADISGIYSVKFVLDGKLFYTDSYSLYNKDIYIPELPARLGYSASWEHFELNGGDITVNAVYTPINYNIEFFVEETYAGAVTCSIVDFKDKIPAVPEKLGYRGEWIYRAVGDKIIAEASYVEALLTVNFYAFGELVDVRFAEVDCDSVDAPEIPDKYLREHYEAKWEKFSLNANVINVNLYYEPIEYTVLFTGFDSVIEFKYTVETDGLSAPAVPEKPHYNGVWESFEFDYTNAVVNAVYTPVVYKVEFYADGALVHMCEYTVEHTSIDIPKPPEKAGFLAEWQNFELVGGNVRVDAVYTKAPPTDGLTFDISNGNYAQVTGYTGSNGFVVIPSEYGGLPVREIAKEAFYDCATLKSISLPNSLERIGEFAFSRCGLVEIVIPKNVKIIETYSFYGCENLVSADLGDGVTTVMEYAFAGNESLKTVKIGKSVTKIEACAFFASENIQRAEFADPDGWKLDPPNYQNDVPAMIKESPEKAGYVLYFYTNNTLYKDG